MFHISRHDDGCTELTSWKMSKIILHQHAMATIPYPHLESLIEFSTKEYIKPDPAYEQCVMIEICGSHAKYVCTMARRRIPPISPKTLLETCRITLQQWNVLPFEPGTRYEELQFVDAPLPGYVYRTVVGQYDFRQEYARFVQQLGPQGTCAQLTQLLRPTIERVGKDRLSLLSSDQQSVLFNRWVDKRGHICGYGDGYWISLFFASDPDEILRHEQARLEQYGATLDDVFNTAFLCALEFPDDFELC